ncbi:MAG: sortase [Aggregatilineales bacterium]
MRDRRSVDDLTIEELEQILLMKKREARLARLERYKRTGRRRGDLPLPYEPPTGADDAEPLPYHSYLDDEPAPRRRTTRDTLLLTVEVLAVVGLLAVLVFTALSLRGINREAAQEQAEAVAALPTLEPTPLIRAVVLPGGHTPPTDGQAARPNYDEVPARLRPLVEQQFTIPVIAETPTPGQAVRIRIPAIGVDSPVVQGDGWEQLKKGVAQHLGTANPGEAGNVVLSGHNDIYGEVFRDLDKLQPGDEVILYTQTREFVYRVAHTRIVPPTEVSVMDPTREPIVTLISCYPYRINTDRIVVVAELVE